MEPTPVPAKRPWYLTVLLILAGILYLLLTLSVLLIPASVQQEAYGVEFPSWYVLTSAALLVVSIIGVGVIFAWKKWGFSALAGAAVLSVIVDYMAIPQSVLGAIMTLLPPVLIFLAMRPVWANFK